MPEKPTIEIREKDNGSFAVIVWPLNRLDAQMLADELKALLYPDAENAWEEHTRRSNI